MYKVTGKAACGKEQFDDADRKGMYQNKLPKYMKRDESKGENKFHLIMEKYTDTDAKTQDPKYELSEVYRGSHIQLYSDPLHEVAIIQRVNSGY